MAVTVTPSATRSAHGETAMNRIEEPTANTTRLVRVKEMSSLPGYAWANERYLRHLISEAKDRVGSGGTIIPGNGLATAIIRIGRKVFIDLDALDEWVDCHRSGDSN